MSKSKHTEAQMIAALKQVEAGRKVEDVAREVWGVEAHHLCLEGEVRRDGCDARLRKPSSCGMRTRGCASWWRI